MIPKVLVTFDFEGRWGMPFAAAYNLTETTNRLLETLAKHRVQAVFFVVGQLAEAHPDIVSLLAAGGHEVGLHGYGHTHLHNLDDRGVERFQHDLAKAQAALVAAGVPSARGFRAPYLMGPAFYRADVYQVLAKAGITWASNREIRFPEEISRPDRLPALAPLWEYSSLRRAALVALNLQLVRHDKAVGPSMAARCVWLDQPQPFPRVSGITEVPLTSPLDCDLLGFPHPDQASSPELLAYATKLLTRTPAQATTIVLSFHDWIIGSGNRLQVLDRVLDSISTGKPA